MVPSLTRGHLQRRAAVTEGESAAAVLWSCTGQCRTVTVVRGGAATLLS